MSKYKDLPSKPSVFTKKAFEFYQDIISKEDTVKKEDGEKKKALSFLSSWFTGRTITNKTSLILEKVGVLQLVLDGKIEEAKLKLSEHV